MTSCASSFAGCLRSPVLRFFLDLSVAEAAAALGTREGTVKAYTARALARMRELFDADDRDARTTPIGVPHAD